MLKFSYVGDYNKDVNSGLQGQQFRNLIGVCFLIEPPFKSSPNDRMLPSFRRGAIYLLESIHGSWNRYFYFYFWEALGFEATLPQLCTFPHGFTRTNTCPIETSNGICLGCDVCECHAKFQIDGESFAHMDQQKTCLGYVAPKPQWWQMSSFGSWAGSIVHKLRPHSHVRINPKIANFANPKLFTW